ncbi:hypothetical protein ASPCADRAFT_202428 [Aspergillus carbonarius ITEM 5010]|uniref:Uncharacterized protein n=1 Tax=Aspergillus carbonarius (strain ITEM 5010) TaxID=602072 RepID=A0A1R3S1H0_ASPC5|nr:hypothetical protein ASPCADRAFT_202428 [Aspergillus carbonarius ITEM 5010]
MRCELVAGGPGPHTRLPPFSGILTLFSVPRQAPFGTVHVQSLWSGVRELQHNNYRRLFSTTSLVLSTLCGVGTTNTDAFSSPASSLTLIIYISVKGSQITSSKVAYLAEREDTQVGRSVARKACTQACIRQVYPMGTYQDGIYPKDECSKGVYQKVF